MVLTVESLPIVVTKYPEPLPNPTKSAQNDGLTEVDTQSTPEPILAYLEPNFKENRLKNTRQECINHISYYLVNSGVEINQFWFDGLGDMTPSHFDEDHTYLVLTIYSDIGSYETVCFIHFVEDSSQQIEVWAK